MPVKSLVKDLAIAPKTNWKKVKYPAIGVAENGIAVMFTSYGKGMVIKTGNNLRNYDIGHYYMSWDMDAFSLAPTTQQFILSNR